VVLGIRSARRGGLERSADFGVGQGAFAHDGPLVAIDAHDGGGKGAAGVARIKYQGKLAAELLDDFVGVAAGRPSGQVGAGTGDGAASSFDHGGRDARISPAQCHASAVAGNFEGQAVRRFNNECERARPEFAGQCEKSVGDIASKRNGLLDGIHQYRQRAIFRPSLDLENALDGRQIEWIGGKAVKGVGRNTDNSAPLDKARSIFNNRSFRSVG